MASKNQYSIHHVSIKNGSPSMENQDSKSVWFKYPRHKINKTDKTLITDHLIGFIAVYDGHGHKNGKFVSQYVKNYFDKTIVKNWKLINKNFNKTIDKIFKNLSMKLRQKLLEKVNLRNYQTREVQLDSPFNECFNCPNSASFNS